MELYKKSSYLNIVKSKVNYSVYNSLLGNLFTLNDYSIKLLEHFAEATSIDDIVKLYEQEEQEEIQKYCTLFKNLYYIKNIDFDEREILNKVVSQRKEKINTGDFVGGIQLNVANSCNFSCSYSFVNSTEQRRKREYSDLDY